MSNKSKNSDLDRPSSPEVLKQARIIADRYQIVLEQEDDYWFGHGLEMPTVFGEGKTPQTCVKDTREALVASVAIMLEEGQRPPIPASEGKRTEQVNVRLTAEEKAVLTATSQARGFKGLGDYMRAAALSGNR